MGVLNPGAGEGAWADVFRDGSTSVAPSVGVGVGVTVGVGVGASEVDIGGATLDDVASVKTVREVAEGAGSGAAGEAAVDAVWPALVVS
jgi:hypothetical protein